MASTKYIFVCGGVMSGVGKGVATASIGKILQSRGFNVTALKIDPYINVDAGTMNPVEHGEVFVTNDGDECDQDIGNYERFLNINIYKGNYLTTGRVYESVIHKERNLEYGGRCVEVVPDIPNEVISRIKNAAKKAKADFVLVEIGGTVGEYQNLLFLEAGRIMKLTYPKDVLFILVSYAPVPQMIGEMKTKPTQWAVRSLNSAGIQPDILLIRSEKLLDEPRKRKLLIFCNVGEKDIISAPDIESIYEIPLNFEKEKLSNIILQKFGLKPKKENLKEWKKMVNVIKNPEKKVKIAIAGKYFRSGKFTLMDSYISVIEAVKHAAYSFKAAPEITWIDTEEYEKSPKKLKKLKSFDAIIVPGGFGSRGVEGKIKVIEYCRKNKIPFLGLCYGMQLVTIEFARNVCGLKNANSTEINPKTKHPVIDIMAEQKEKLKEKKYGGTMRLGAYACEIISNTKSFKAYGLGKKDPIIFERHRHRYEFNNKYRELLEKKGLKIAGVNPDLNLVEIIEIEKHPFFVATQFHPEFLSRPLHPHPLFRELIKTALK
ncbi:CTP synthase [Candidatus Wolfebacteria bacterium CG03_land_8_20_14_0_80_36_15]|uniref:CTP synthase n=1 Tax=Candidatus Wolfebacteria bacterium CG03_land_8_20_14_0_80_36_15 TaxID=1975067 RepID=A0A2M7B7Q3_9BACT|nr:MAG: CTP synthase [Candidatus Wolfebacteria bacterium CG03_land_8_20_14_0_80_36_15]